MRRGTLLLSMVVLAALVLSAGCKRGAEADLSKLGPSTAATTTVLPVGSSNCPAGGIGIYTGNDTNASGVLEPGEYLKGSPVCDQLTDAGSPLGTGALVMVVSEPSSTLHCLAGGMKVLSGMDANKNGVLDAAEIGFTDYLCNGTPGASSAAGITVSVAPAAAPCARDEKGKKGRKQEPAKKPAANKAPGRSADKAAAKPAKEAKKESAEAAAAAAPDAPAEPAAPPKKAEKKAPAAAAVKEKKAPAKPAAAPAGWTAVKVNSPQLATVAYKVEGRTIAVRFTNLSSASSVRFKYTVRWKVNQNGTWVDDSTMEGISFRLKPQETLDREVRTQTPDVRDVVVDLDVVETS